MRQQALQKKDYRCPINHPAVMYKKSAVEKAGSYGKFRFAQDYHLWARMIVNDAKFYNIQEPLVHMRAGYAQLERRSGFAYTKNELNLLKEFRKIGFLNNYEFIRNLCIRFVARVMPKTLVKIIYKSIRSQVKEFDSKMVTGATKVALPNNIYLACDDVPLSTSKLIELIAKNLNKKVYLIKVPFFESLLKLAKPSFYKRLYGSLEVDNSITKEKLNLKNPYSVEEGIELMLNGEF